MSLGTPRVLCVDDDADSCLMLVTMLNVACVEAKSVSTANQAIALSQLEQFDLYILDAWLPEIDGFDLCRRIREFDLSTPIIFYSGAARPVDQKKGIDAGANAYVTKPDIYGLVARIKQFNPKFVDTPVINLIGSSYDPTRARFASTRMTMSALQSCELLESTSSCSLPIC